MKNAMVVVKTYIILYDSHISHTIQVATTLLVASKRAGRGIYLEIFFLITVISFHRVLMQ